MRSTKNLAGADGSAPTSGAPLGGKPKTRSPARLTQQQLNEWWPFTRLNPKMFPSTSGRIDPLDDVEEAPI